MRWEHNSSVSEKTLGAAKMPISTKVECTHCGSALKTTKAVLPGAKVKCPRCKGVFEVPASDGDELLETIPIEGDAGTTELDPVSSGALATVVEGGKGAKGGKDMPGAAVPERARDRC